MTATMSRTRGAPSMDVVLIPTHRLCEQWACNEGDNERSPMHPLERMRLLHDGAVLGGGDVPQPVEVKILAEIISKAPTDVHAFVRMWYCDHSPVYIKADRLGISRTTIYAELKGHLQYLRGRLHERRVKV